MLKPDTAFHLGPEFDNALNRMDFFRLFKALATHFDAQYFLLVEAGSDEMYFDIQGGHSLHNMPDGLMDSKNGLSRDEPLLAHALESSAARSFSPDETSSPLLKRSAAKSAVCVPLNTVTAKRYALVLLRDRERPQHRELALIAHEAALVFQRYFDVILSLDSMTGLSDREIQIVRWTSEGKTSAEIAIILGLSEHTVNSYIAAILRKLQVVNRAQMVASALRSGMIN